MAKGVCPTLPQSVAAVVNESSALCQEIVRPLLADCLLRAPRDVRGMRLRLLFVLLITSAAWAAEPRWTELILIRSLEDVPVRLVVFDEHDFALTVIDNARDGHPRYANVEEAVTAAGAVAGCNGGFFDREPFNPFGLMIHEGKRFGRFDPQSWLAGVLVIRGGHATLEASRTFTPANGVTFALQSGPWLVRDGRSETGLDPQRRAQRTFVAHDGRGHWALGAADACTGPELAAFLRSDTMTHEIDVQEALNFDGGPSTGLFLKTATQRHYVREGWPVRNYIAVVARSTAP